MGSGYGNVGVTITEGAAGGTITDAGVISASNNLSVDETSTLAAS
jgi:hypothetical protein